MLKIRKRLFHLTAALLVTFCFVLLFDSRVSKLTQPEQKKSYLSTIVTSYYKLGSRSKHSDSEYEDWIKNFLPRINSSLVIFTDQYSYSLMREHRKGLPTLIIIQDLWASSRMASYKDNYFSVQHGLDPEKAIHYPELYAIWNSKSLMVKQVAEQNPFNSDFFFWVDIGVFREDHHFRDWPDPQKVLDIFSHLQPNTILLELILPPKSDHIKHWEEKDGPMNMQDMMAGGFFGGTAEAIRWWESEFFRLHDKYLQQGIFVGKDQNIMNTLTLINKKRIAFIESYKQNCVDPYFLFQQALANNLERWSTCKNPTIGQF